MKKKQMILSIPCLITLGIFISILSSCEPKKKTPQEIYKEKLETHTDEELLDEYYGSPQNYKVNYVKLEQPCLSSELIVTPEIKSGAVVQVIFNKGKVNISGIGTLLGSYEQAYYANEDGSITAKIAASKGVADLLTGGRYHPSVSSKYIDIITKRDYITNSGLGKCTVSINYTLQILK